MRDESSISENSTPLESGPHPKNTLRPHLARLTNIQGVNGAFIVGSEGELHSAMLSESLEVAVESAIPLIKENYTQLATLHSDDTEGILFQFSQCSLFVRQLDEQIMVCIVDQSVNFRLLRVGLRVFALKMQQGSPTDKPDATAEQSALQHSNQAVPEDVIGVWAISALEEVLESFMANGQASALLHRVVRSMNLHAAAVTTDEFDQIVAKLVRFIRPPTMRLDFQHQASQLQMQAAKTKSRQVIQALQQQVAMLSKGIKICSDLVTLDVGTKEDRDDEKSLAELAELTSELTNSGLTVCPDFLKLGDRLLTFDEELSYAGQLQRSLIPDSATKLRHDVVSFYRPTMHCGGDWWSLRELPNNQFLVAIADVTGHGTPAAILTGILKGAWDQIPSDERSPSKILNTLNTSIYDSFRKKMMATCAVSLIDLDGMDFCIASAGHNFPYLVRPSNTSKKNKLSSLLARGNALGSEKSPEYEETCVPLLNNDLIVWYTDGVTECTNIDGEQFGDKRFRRFFANTDITTDPSVVRDVFIERMSQFCGERALDDDATLVLTKITKIG